MSFISSITQGFVDRIANAVSDRVLTNSGLQIAQARAYRLGKQPKQLKVNALKGQYDDNITLNFTGLIADRNVSQLIGGGIEFKFEEQDEQEPEAPVQSPVVGEQPEVEAEPEETPQETYLEAVWDANHKEILLHRAVLATCEAGTGYILLCDPGLNMGGMAGEDGVTYPRLLLLDPAFVTMDTLPEDFEMVIRYTIQYKFTDVTGKEAQRRKVIEQDPETNAWVIVDYENSYATGGKFVEVARLEWPHPFGPVVHWQNLPTIDSPYGEPDITDDLIDLQDKMNGHISFLSKALRLGVHTQKWVRGDITNADAGPDKMLKLGPDGEMGQLTPNTDWAGALAFFKTLRAGMFDITRTVDIDSLEDRLGAMTNFALKIIYADNLSKIETKKELLSDALEEINRRLMVIGGYPEIDTEVIWPDVLPINEQERSTFVQALLTAGIISKETAFEMLELPGSWEDEQARMEKEKAANVASLPPAMREQAVNPNPFDRMREAGREMMDGEQQPPGQEQEQVTE